MAIDAVRHRGGTQNAAAAAKQRRERIMLVVGVILLAGLLTLEGPKTLRKLHSSSPAPAPVATTPQQAGTTIPTTHPVDLRALRNLAAKDPFAAQIVAGTAGSAPRVTLALSPPIRTTYFVAKDPFVPQQLTTATAAAPAVGPKTPGTATTGNFVVIVISVPLAQGPAGANKAAERARARGVRNVHVVFSSEYPTLRRGFYAVYSGPYPTLAQTLSALRSIRGRGYVSAFTRRLGH
jgi:hypothetical protein